MFTLHQPLPCSYTLKTTDGVQEIVENQEAFWILQLVASLQVHEAVKGQWFQLYIFDPKQKVVIVEDGNENELYRQKVSPMHLVGPVKMYFIEKTLMLPEEY